MGRPIKIILSIIFGLALLIDSHNNWNDYDYNNSDLIAGETTTPEVTINHTIVGISPIITGVGGQLNPEDFSYNPNTRTVTFHNWG